MINPHTKRLFLIVFLIALVNCTKLNGNTWESGQGWKVLTRFAFDSTESTTGVISFSFDYDPDINLKLAVYKGNDGIMNENSCVGKTNISNVYTKGKQMDSESFIVDLDDLAGLEKGHVSDTIKFLHPSELTYYFFALFTCTGNSSKVEEETTTLPSPSPSDDVTDDPGDNNNNNNRLLGLREYYYGEEESLSSYYSSSFSSQNASNYRFAPIHVKSYSFEVKHDQSLCPQMSGENLSLLIFRIVIILLFVLLCAYTYQILYRLRAQDNFQIPVLCLVVSIFTYFSYLVFYVIDVIIQCTSGKDTTGYTVFYNIIRALAETFFVLHILVVAKGLKITKVKISANARIVVTAITLSYFFLLLIGDFYHLYFTDISEIPSPLHTGNYFIVMVIRLIICVLYYWFGNSTILHYLSKGDQMFYNIYSFTLVLYTLYPIMMVFFLISPRDIVASVVDGVDTGITFICYCIFLTLYNPNYNFVMKFPYFTNKGQMSSKIEKCIRSKEAQNKVQTGWQLLKQIKTILDKLEDQSGILGEQVKNIITEYGIDIDPNLYSNIVTNSLLLLSPNQDRRHGGKNVIRPLEKEETTTLLTSGTILDNRNDNPTRPGDPFIPESTNPALPINNFHEPHEEIEVTDITDEVFNSNKHLNNNNNNSNRHIRPHDNDDNNSNHTPIQVKSQKPDRYNSITRKGMYEKGSSSIPNTNYPEDPSATPQPPPDRRRDEFDESKEYPYGGGNNNQPQQGFMSNPDSPRDLNDDQIPVFTPPRNRRLRRAFGDEPEKKADAEDFIEAFSPND